MTRGIFAGLARAWGRLSGGKVDSSEQLASRRMANIRVSAALGLLACSPAAWAWLVSSPNSVSGSYNVNWDFPLGCTDYDVYGQVMTDCLALDESFNGGPYTQVTATGTQYAFTNRPAGTYQYRIRRNWYSPVWGWAGEDLWSQGPLTVQVGSSSWPKPSIIATATPVGPWSNPFYYVLTWTAANASANSCELELRSVIPVPNGPTLFYTRNVGPLPTSGTYNMDKGPVPNTDWVQWELTCSGPGGSSDAGGALWLIAPF